MGYNLPERAEFFRKKIDAFELLIETGQFRMTEVNLPNIMTISKHIADISKKDFLTTG